MAPGQKQRAQQDRRAEQHQPVRDHLAHALGSRRRECTRHYRSRNRRPALRGAYGSVCDGRRPSPHRATAPARCAKRPAAWRSSSRASGSPRSAGTTMTSSAMASSAPRARPCARCTRIPIAIRTPLIRDRDGFREPRVGTRRLRSSTPAWPRSWPRIATGSASTSATPTPTTSPTCSTRGCCSARCPRTTSTRRARSTSSPSRCPAR